jgi:hypothetical protein
MSTVNELEERTLIAIIKILCEDNIFWLRTRLFLNILLLESACF